MQNDFQVIKNFFISRQNDYVVYHVEDKECGSAYYMPYSKAEDFYLRFEGVHLGVDHGKDRYVIDSYDSYVFGFYVVNYGDKVVLTDNRRSIECGISPEGNLVDREQVIEIQKLVEKSGFSLQNDEILKETTAERFVEDVIELVRLMLLINYVDRKPPYIKMNGEIRKDVQALKKSWKKKRK